MRKIDLRPYNVRRALQHDVVCPTCEKTLPRDAILPAQYAVKDSLVELCFVPAEGCKGRELLKRHALAEKIEAATDDVLLEDAEWDRLVQAVDRLPGIGRNDVELVRRVLDAPGVPVAEKTTEPTPEGGNHGP